MLEIRPRLIVQPVNVSYADKFYQIFITGHVFRKQNKVIILGHFSADRSLNGHIVGHINFAAYNRLNLERPALGYKPVRIRILVGMLYRRLDKFQSAVHIPVVGYCNGRHTKLVAALKNFRNTGSSVQKTVFGMNVQMYEFFHLLLLFLTQLFGNYAYL